MTNTPKNKRKRPRPGHEDTDRPDERTGARPPAEAWRTRIVGEADVDPSTLTAHPDNWRAHPPGQQAALEQVLAEVGWVQRVVVNRRTGRTVDGHLRVELALSRKESSIPVVYVDLSDEEELLVLSTFDPIAALAKTQRGKLTSILERVRKGREELFDRVNMAGYRAGAGHSRQSVESWATSDSFFDVPENVAPVLARTRTLVVQYSGGKDSTAAALWAAKHRDGRDLLLVFTDPGVEFPGISSHVQDVANFLQAEAVVVKPALDWWCWLAKEGQWPSILHRPCAMKFVHHPFGEYLKQQDPETTLLLTGSRAEEAMRGSKKTSTSRLESAHARTGKFEHFAPAFSAQKSMLEQVITESGVPLWEGYSRGFVRTACWCCPGQCGAQALALTKNYPGLAEDIRRWEKRIGPLQPQSLRGGKYGVSFDQLVAAGQKQEES